MNKFDVSELTIEELIESGMPLPEYLQVRDVAKLWTNNKILQSKYEKLMRYAIKTGLLKCRKKPDDGLDLNKRDFLIWFDMDDQISIVYFFSWYQGLDDPKPALPDRFKKSWGVGQTDKPEKQALKKSIPSLKGMVEGIGKEFGKREFKDIRIRRKQYLANLWRLYGDEPKKREFLTRLQNDGFENLVVDGCRELVVDDAGNYKYKYDCEIAPILKIDKNKGVWFSFEEPEDLMTILNGDVKEFGKSVRSIEKDISDKWEIQIKTPQQT